MKRVESLLEKTIFASRWILAPFYLGLSLSLLVLLYEFIHEIIDFLTSKENKWSIIVSSKNSYWNTKCDRKITMQKGNIQLDINS